MNRPGATERRLVSLGLVLPAVPQPIGQFQYGRIEGPLLFLSGQGPLLATGLLATGKVGADVTVDEARQHAMRTGLVLLSAMKLIVGDLDRVAGVVKLLGFVNCTAEFDGHATVLDGCSDLFHAVFGARGSHARSAIGVASLPGRITVEIEAVVSITT